MRHDRNPAVTRQTQGVLLGALVVATAVMLAMAIAWALNQPNCKAGFPTLINCTFVW
jgi:hypothetical protein